MKATLIMALFLVLFTVFTLIFPLYQFRIIRNFQFIPIPFFIAIGLAVIINVAALSLFSLFVTHKMVGPLYSLVRALRQLAEGKVGVQVQQRANDEFGFLFRNFNEASERIKEWTKSDLKKLRDSGHSLPELEKDLKSRLKEGGF